MITDNKTDTFANGKPHSVMKRHYITAISCVMTLTLSVMGSLQNWQCWQLVGMLSCYTDWKWANAERSASDWLNYKWMESSIPRQFTAISCPCCRIWTLTSMMFGFGWEDQTKKANISAVHWGLSYLFWLIFLIKDSFDRFDRVAHAFHYHVHFGLLDKISTRQSCNSENQWESWVYQNNWGR